MRKMRIIGSFLLMLCFIVTTVEMSVSARNIVEKESGYAFLEESTGTYQISGFMGMDDFVLYSLRQGNLINPHGYAYCQCIALSFRYDKETGFTEVNWKDSWVSDKENAGVVMTVSDKTVYQDCGDYIECNDILFCVVAFDDYGQPQSKFYYAIEDASGYVPWEAFTKTGAVVAPILNEEKMPIMEAVTHEGIKAYYQNSVFLGDSIIYGLSKYKSKEMSAFLEGMEFLAVGGFSSNNASKCATGNNLHPVYQGKKRQVWESIAMMQLE